MAGLGWLHLTDLLVGTTGTLWQQPRIRDEMERDLDWLHERVGAIDLILITGNLAANGTETEYALVTEGLASLQNFLARHGAHPTVLAVPGSHDLVRTAATVGADPASWEVNSHLRDVFFDYASHPFRHAVTSAFTPFVRWAEVWRRPPPGDVRLARKDGLLPGDFAFTITKSTRRFGIAGLNTAFLELSSGSANGSLDVDPRQLEAAAGDLDAWARSHDACLLLTHHPPSALSPQAFKRFKITIAPPGRFALHLAGSLHNGRPLQDYPHTPVFSASPLTLRSTVGRKGYAAGRLDLDTGRILLWSRILAFSSSGAPFFAGDPTVPNPIPRTFFPRRPDNPAKFEESNAVEALILPTADEARGFESKKEAAPPAPPQSRAAPIAAFAPSAAPALAPGSARAPAPAATPENRHPNLTLLRSVDDHLDPLKSSISTDHKFAPVDHGFDDRARVDPGFDASW